MAKTIEVTFAFDIGDEVVCGTAQRLADHSAELYSRTHGNPYKNKKGITVPVFQVIERIAQECPGGVQRHYVCRGYVADKYGDGAGHLAGDCKFLEHELVPYVPASLPATDSGGASDG